MKLQFVTVMETGASELLPLHPETVRVFLILKAPRADGMKKPPNKNPSPLSPPWPAVRHSRARPHSVPG